MQIWTPDILRQKQKENNDLKSVIQWLKDDNKPDWKAQSPALAWLFSVGLLQPIQLAAMQFVSVRTQFSSTLNRSTSKKMGL